jgi:RHS repeat-associated protein
VESRYKSTNHEKDAETGYDDRNARFYDDEALRFVQVDPSGSMFPGLSLYQYCANNPILYSDPTGKAHYYASDGLYLGKDNLKNEDVYSVKEYTQKSEGHYSIEEKNRTLLKDSKGNAFTHKEFLILAGTVMNEMDAKLYDKNEASAIYSVIENRANAKNQSELWVTENTGIYGWNHKDDISKSSFYNKSKVAIAGVMESMISDFDFSNGGYWWQGKDFRKHYNGMRAYEDYYLVGLKFTDPSHDHWGMGDHVSGKKGYDYKYQSTSFFGGTTFLRLTEDWQKLNKHLQNYR